MLFPSYAYITFTFQGCSTAPIAGFWFETTSDEAAEGYVAGYNAASAVVKAKVEDFLANAREPPKGDILKMFSE